MSSLAKTRLQEERKNWRKDHPYGFYAKPKKNADGSLDMMTWECGVPGKRGTLWEGGLYKLLMKFPQNYPESPPNITFTPVLFHPNIYPDGKLCLSITNAHEQWKPSLTVKQILLGIHELLDEPNCDSPANQNASHMYRRNRIQYDTEVKAQAKKYAFG